MASLPETVSCIVGCLEPREWASLMCASRDLKAQMLHVLASQPVQVTVDCSIRSWRASLQAVGVWCGCITSLSLLRGSARSLSSMQLLQPLLQSHLTQLTLRGLRLNGQECHATQLVALLRHNCPNLETLDLQDCDLPHLGAFAPLMQPPAQQQGDTQHAHAPQSSKLKRLQLTSARLSPGVQHMDKSIPTRLRPAPAVVYDLAASKLSDTTRGCGSNGKRGASSSLAGNHTAQSTATAAVADTLVGTSSCHSGGLCELRVGCGCDEVDAAWLASNGAVSSRDVAALLQDRCKDLQVLDVCKRPSISGDLMRHLAADPPTCLHTLDISLTHVTPQGLLQLVPHCRQLAVLRYACRSGEQGLDSQTLTALAAVLPVLQELDLSLHPHLDDTGLAALAQCSRLRQVKFARSHKITGAGLEHLVLALPELQQLRVVRCRGVSKASLARVAAARPGLHLHM